MKKVDNYKSKKSLKKIKTIYKNEQKIIKFDDTKIKQCKFHQNKSTILINDIDINKIVVSDKLLFSKYHFKYFIGYKDAKIIRPLCISFSKVNP